jgi:NADP-dependent 3-hydroxy acid dehydrogenase YdfG
MCSAASANRLTPLKDQLGAGFIRLMFDVTDEAAVSEEATKASERLAAQRDGLVNSAGICVPEPILPLSIRELRHHIEVNVLAKSL